ncbi:ImmA/IrrE family metallo-endopeptidase [Streptomyces fagopyri]|uniref:ImmA/IrrE family metallo-endopeptidase n=1 Tax=Streptomyces fagopyri TaxID=2662397 RepID=A0A5Q0LLN6_9ACTN|nr:ImmA/IrrE family metallo-endopeptidase [Streptomyces fagopyri]QFZ77389.1 ImmA/IrrE family metallo-endopeptidase [Streptomyces fagopyri]
MGQRWTKKALQDLALDVRREIDAGPNSRLDLTQLAGEYGVPVYAMSDLGASGCSTEALDHFTLRRPEAWSAALVPVGTARLIVENCAHTLQRRRSNVAHEMSHLILEHEFEGILFADGGCRELGPEMAVKERQASDLSGELLIPMSAAIAAALAKKSDEEVAEQFDVSVRFAAWRMNASGARKIAQRTLQKRAAGSRR